jgi:competence protein ComEA
MTDNIYQELIYKFRWQISLLLIGLSLVGIGVFLTKSSYSSPEVEIINDSVSQNNNSKLIIEVGGSVIKPGVYELVSNSRINDALSAAGGLSEDADQDWVDKMINRAAPLSDGQKIYIPSKHSSSQSASNLESNQASSEMLGQGTESLININTASQKELESLWGIGPVTAQNIIEQRPYSTVDELQSKNILKANVYERNKDLLTVY